MAEAATFSFIIFWIYSRNGTIATFEPAQDHSNLLARAANLPSSKAICLFFRFFMAVSAPR
jgi:hypothetical protein